MKKMYYVSVFYATFSFSIILISIITYFQL